MKLAQAFRVAGTANLVAIEVSYFQGHNVVFWDDIVLRFPTVQYIQRHGVMITKLRDEKGASFVPHCYKYHPDDVLDVVLSTAAVDIPTRYSNAPSSMVVAHSRASTLTDTPRDLFSLPPNIIGTLSETHQPTSPSPAEPQQSAPPHTNVTHMEYVLYSTTAAAVLANQNGTPLSAEQIMALLLSKLTPDSASKPGFENTVNHKLDELYNQGTTIYNQGTTIQQIVTEVLEQQKQINNRVILIQSKTMAILTQQLEIAEYPIPRLFIVLPEGPRKYDPASWFRTKFRLHFICECGEHTQVAGSRIPHHPHLAKHEGYPVREPTELFKKYGPFLLIMLELIKRGASIDGHTVPAVARMRDSGQQTNANVTAQIDYSLECIDKQMSAFRKSSEGDMSDADEPTPMTHQDLENYLANVEGLEGVELRQLGSFLTTSSTDNLFGKLYRMTTPDGHVKWVCRDHYRSGYQEVRTQRLRDVVNLAGGKFDEHLGTIEIDLNSSLAAEEFYDTLCEAKGVLGLVLNLRWDCTRKDISSLRKALKRSLVATLYADVQRFQPSFGSQILPIPTQYDPLCRLLEPTNLRSVHLVLPKDLLKISNFSPKRPLHLQSLTYEIVAGSSTSASASTDIRVLAEVNKSNQTHVSLYLRDNLTGKKDVTELVQTLRTNPPMTSLNLESHPIGDKGAQALSEALMVDLTLKDLYVESNSIGERGVQALSDALKINRALTNLRLRINTFGEQGAQALSGALQSNSTLAILHMGSNSIGDRGAQELAKALKINSTLVTLRLGSNDIGEEGALALAESLKSNSTLKQLFLGLNPIGERGACGFSDALKRNSALTTLCLSCCSIGEEGVQALSFALMINSSLTNLYLGSNAIGETGVRVLSQALKNNLALKNLFLGSNKIGDHGAQALSDVIRTNPTLTTLNLKENSIREKGARALFEALGRNSTLTNLSLESNLIGDNGAFALSVAIKTNLALSTLNLKGASIGERGGQALFEELKANLALTNLHLGSNSIGEKAVQMLSEALITNSTLTNLFLDSNPIGENGARALSEALKINSTLTVLSLESCFIGGKGAQALSEALKINSALVELCLESNSIGEQGAMALSEALRANSALAILNLRDNAIGERGALALLRALEVNVTLTTLNLSSNSIGSRGGQALAALLMTNSALVSLQLGFNAIEISTFSEALRTNSTLKITC